MFDFRYDNYGDASQHLNNTVVMTGIGIPFYIQDRGDGWVWSVLALGDHGENAENIDLRDLNITFEPIQLGYCNHQGLTPYLIRKPIRMWRQGLCHDNLASNNNLITNNVIRSKGLLNTILNVYPSLFESFNKVMERGGGCAFHRDFSLVSMESPLVNLEYKGDVVGFINETGDFDIEEKYSFIREQLSEVIHAEN